MAFLVFLQWIQWMAGWVGVHSKGTMQQDVIYGDVRWGTAHYPSQVRLRARPLDHPLKLHSPASQTVPFTKTVRGGCYRAIYTDKPTPADDPTQMNAEHWFHHLTMQSTKRWNFISLLLKNLSPPLCCGENRPLGAGTWPECLDVTSLQKTTQLIIFYHLQC